MDIIETAQPVWNPEGRAVFEDGTSISLKNGCLNEPYALMFCQCHLKGLTPMALHPKMGYQPVEIKGGVFNS